jgi:4'-phosphopantetheinyl transferase
MDIEFHDWRDIPEDQASAAGCGRGRLQIWTSVMPVDLDCIKEISTCLSRDERDRASRYLTEESQLEFLFGRSVLRHVIGVWLGVEPASLIFGYGPKGKPFLQFPSVAEALQFNLSHSHGRFVIALCEGRSVGVDIERIECEMDWLPVARRY